jgi:uncharacterized membrane protein YjgN (DUF898 family)
VAAAYAPPVADVPVPDPGGQIHRVTFTGSAREYFRIWIVNLLLTVTTLGLYSPWAKVRKRRWFYTNTWLGDGNFEYHADPVRILKGRLLAAAAFVFYGVTAYLTPRIGAVALLVVAGAAPWMWLRSLAFAAANSSYRNVRFRFRGRYRDALRAMAPLAIGPLAVLVDPAPSLEGAAGLTELLAPTALLLLAYPAMVGARHRLRVDGTAYGTTALRCRARLRQFYGVYLASAIVVLVLVAGLALLVHDVGTPSALVALLGAYVTVPIVFYGLTTAEVTNLVLNGTEAGEHGRFVSTLSPAKLARLYLTNVVAVSLSGGLLVPWAAVRTARYRASALAFATSAGLDLFAAVPRGDVAAAGEELTEMFDFGMSL